MLTKNDTSERGVGMQPARYKAKMRKQATREATRNSLLRKNDFISKEIITKEFNCFAEELKALYSQPIDDGRLQ